MGEHNEQGAALARFPWWPLVMALVVVGGVVLGLYGLTPVDQRAGMLRGVGGALTGLVAAAVAALSAWLTHRLHGETTQQGQTLATIQKQTNGVLDARIQSGVSAALEAAGLVTRPQAGYDRPAPVVVAAPAAVPAPELEDDSGLAPQLEQG